MELAAVLHVLWRFRIVVAVGAVVAIAAGLWDAKGGTARLGVASMRVILDTPKSLTVDVNPPGMDTLEWRAGLLADVMSTREWRRHIAREMGIPIDSLVVMAPYRFGPAAPFPLPRAALDAAAVAPEPYVLAIESVERPPIIEIDARAPSRERAGRLAAAAAAALEAAAPVEELVPGKSQGLVAYAVGPPRSFDVASGPGRLMPGVVAAVVFGFWCAGIVLIAAMASARRSRIGKPVSSGSPGWS
jgi:hypothetical protein